jgi:alkylation response protein AidB-like acyl-CoA dehydrogenase
MADYIERARALGPRIEACADQIEQERRRPEPLVAALHEAGLFRLLLPRSLGGAEVDPPTFVQVIEEIARHDASAAWCLRQTAPLRDSAVIQSQVAVSEGRLRAARGLLIASLEDIARRVGSAGTLTLEQRMSIRLAATHVFREAREVVDLIYHVAGATAIFTGNVFERRFRDMHAVSQQVQARQDHYETVGRFLLGLDSESSFL